jgi:hypothetical protein
MYYYNTLTATKEALQSAVVMGAMTLHIMAFRKTTLSKMTFSILVNKK